MNDDVDVEGNEYRKELKHFLSVERGLNISDVAFLELWHIGEQWHSIRDSDFLKEMTLKEYKTLRGAANKMLSQMDKHEAFLVSIFLFDDDELLDIFRNTLERTVENTQKMIEKLEGPPKKVQSPTKKVERPIRKVKRSKKMHAPAKTRNQFIAHLAEWWKQNAGTPLTYKREGAPFVRLCKELMPGSETSYGTVWRALEKPVKKKGKARGKSALPERKKYRAVGT